MTLVEPLARDQAAILTLYTGVICGPVEDAHDLATALLGGRRPELYELATGETAKELHALVTPVFEAMAAHAAMPEPVWPEPTPPGCATCGGAGVVGRSEHPDPGDRVFPTCPTCGGAGAVT